MMVGTLGHRALFQRRRGCVLFVSFGVKKAANQLRDSAPLHVLAKPRGHGDQPGSPSLSAEQLRSNSFAYCVPDRAGPSR